MNILHIIGNGLDISLGLETQYKSFLKNYYLKKDNPKKIIVKLKQQINQDLDNWSDAELEFGKYANFCDTDNEYFECIKDFKSDLKEYIRSQYQTVINSQTSYNFSKFLSDLKHPESRLEPMVLKRFHTFINSLSQFETDYGVNIMTFNYTRTFEHILQLYNKPSENSINLPKVYHVHGTLDNQMTFGVNDSSQIISEKNIVGESDYFEIVKPLFNDACLNTNNLDCENLINQADIISIYGASIGATDQKWWDLIGNQMQERINMLILYFPFDDTKDTRNEPQYLSKWCTEYKKYLIKRLNLSSADEKIRERIFVNVNIPLFNVIRPKNK